MVFARPDEHFLTTTTTMMMMISGILGDQLGLFLGASLQTITKLDGDDDDDDDDGGGDDDNDDDDDDFRHSGWPAGPASGRQSADDH